MKLSDLLLALRFLGVREAEEDPIRIREIYIENGVMNVVVYALNDEGQRFAANNEIVTETRAYEIELD